MKVGASPCHCADCQLKLYPRLFNMSNEAAFQHNGQQHTKATVCHVSLANTTEGINLGRSLLQQEDLLKSNSVTLHAVT